MERQKAMKTKLRAALTSDLHPVFFGMTCLLLVCVMFSAKMMADDLGVVEQQAWDYLAMPVRTPWLVVN